jgi:hypothetical protein
MRTRRPRTRKRGEIYPSHFIRKEEAGIYKKYFEKWEWEWKATLNFPPEITFHPAQKIFKRWRLRLADVFDIQVAGYRTTRYKNGKFHIECLMFGKNRQGKKLSDCSIHTAVSLFRYHARIENVDNQTGACAYLADHLRGFLSDYAQMDPFNRKLLHDSMKPNRDRFLDNLDGLMADDPNTPCIGGPNDVLDAEFEKELSAPPLNCTRVQT